MNKNLRFWAALVLAAPALASAEGLSIWARQGDLRAAAGNPSAHLSTLALAYNPTNGKLLIAAGGTNASLLEWADADTTGVLLVPFANWSATGTPQPYAAAWVPSRGEYLVVDGNANAILSVAPNTPSQTPTAFLTTAVPTFPAGGLPVDGTYGYYKNQWSGVQQTINRFTLVGTSGFESEYVGKANFDAFFSSGPSQEFSIDSAGKLIVSLRTGTGDRANRGIYRYEPTAGDGGAFVPIVQEADIRAHTGQSNVTIYGVTVDARDNIYFYDIYAGDILKIDRHGVLSTAVIGDDVKALFGDPTMQFTSQYMVAVNNRLVFTTGNVSGQIVAAYLPLDVEMVTIPAADYEPGGPTYAYAIGKYEITNAQFCTFLNDAERALALDPSSPRCSNFWVETSTGDVYMSDVSGYPPTSSERYDRTLYKTSDTPDSKIKYNASLAAGLRFYVLPGFAHHPVGTVSWFGAAKFCNWLTLDAGMDPAERCYHEGPSKADWYPVVAENWATQGMTADERRAWVNDYRGFRLPMDGVNVDHAGPGNASSWGMTANPFNEWYKAAAFDPAAPDFERPGPADGEIVPADHWTYGFGADEITAADANRGDTGFPGWETTPVGWYNGVNELADTTPTADTRNRYGLYDMSGNVAEWVNDMSLVAPWDANYRAVRGGHFANADPKYLSNSTRQIYSARYYAENKLGFRVARAFGYGDFDADGSVGPADYEFFAAALTGPATEVLPGSGHEAADADGDGHVDLRDFAALQARYPR